MSSDAQIAANKRNSKRSTGPRTARGKARTRLNAFKSGIHAKSPVLPGENRADYDKLITALINECRPTGVVEELIVDRIARDMWRLQRLDRIEYTHFEKHIERHKERIMPKQNFEIITRRIALKALQLIPRDKNGRLLFVLTPSPDGSQVQAQNEKREQVLDQLQDAASKRLSLHEPNIDRVLYEGMTRRDDPCPIPELLQQARLIEKNILRNLEILHELQSERLTIDGARRAESAELSSAQALSKPAASPLDGSFRVQPATESQLIDTTQVHPRANDGNAIPSGDDR